MAHGPKWLTDGISGGRPGRPQRFSFAGIPAAGLVLLRQNEAPVKEKFRLPSEISGQLSHSAIKAGWRFCPVP